MNRCLYFLVLVVAACSKAPGSAATPAPMPVSATATGASSASASTAGPASASASAAGSPSASASASATAPGPATAPASDGLDFIEQARTLFRVAACGSVGEVPPRFDSDVVARHCADLDRAYAAYRREWVDIAKPFLASLEPKNLPSVAVYPFGGGDLTSALATFPEAERITTISLEPAGDVRPIDRLAPARLAAELAVHRSHIERLFEKAHSRTDNLDKEAHTELPGEILFALAALVVHGAEPIALRYFRLKGDGSLVYVTEADIQAAAHHPKAARDLFQNAELRFRRDGDGGQPPQVLRHIAFNLDDEHLRADGSLVAYLNHEGKVAAMTKAASHLLWSSHFSTVRDWLLGQMVWMVSDSTGIPPRFVKPAGFLEVTYGTFDGPAPFGLVNDHDARDFKALFASQPHRELEFRYGYPDRDGHSHLIVTEPAPPEAKEQSQDQ